jgi:formylmethanofuran dehydrogenase subunit C
MRGGAIHVEKNAANRVGAGMTGGKIVVSGFLEEVMPTFTIDTIKPKVKIDETESVAGPFYVFLGDLAENGTGKLFVSKKENPQLRRYERFL